jgi:hypothetical protein
LLRQLQQLVVQLLQFQADTEPINSQVQVLLPSKEKTNMAHFAQLDDSNKVLQVIVVNNAELILDGVESDTKGVIFCKSLFGDDTKWVQTSYNGNIRKNYAGIGYTYDSVNDVFIVPQPYPSWTLNENFDWQAPTPYPTGEGIYTWNELTLSWDPAE